MFIKFQTLYYIPLVESCILSTINKINKLIVKMYGWESFALTREAASERRYAEPDPRASMTSPHHQQVSTLASKTPLPA